MTRKQEPTLVVAAVIQRDGDPAGRILVVRRGPDQSGAGFWEFPGGKVEPSESPEQALIREIQEELSLSIRVKEFVGEEDYAYPTKLIRLRVYRALVRGDEELQLTEHDAFKWQTLDEVQVEELSAADRPFVAKLRGLL